MHCVGHGSLPYGMSLAIAFIPVLEIFTETVLWSCLSFIVITVVRRLMRAYMERNYQAEEIERSL